MVSGVPSWISLLGKMKESRDCDAEARNVHVKLSISLRIRCRKCSQITHVRTKGRLGLVWRGQSKKTGDGYHVKRVGEKAGERRDGA